MEKLYKIGQWLLWNKERMVLIVLLGVLCFKVYNVMAKSDEIDANATQKAYRPPGGEPPPGWYDSEDAPKEPPLPPPPWQETPYNGLVRRNPFTVWGHTDDPKEDPDAVPGNISLVMIRKWPDGSWRAGIRTRVQRYYEEGEAFESYRVLQIDAANGTVEIYSDQLGKPFTLSLAPK